MHQGSRFALKALMYTGPPTWVSSYSIPIFSHLEVSDLGEPFILHNDQDLVSCLLPSNEKMPSINIIHSDYFLLFYQTIINTENYLFSCNFFTLFGVMPKCVLKLRIIYNYLTALTSGNKKDLKSATARPID